MDKQDKKDALIGKDAKNDPNPSSGVETGGEDSSQITEGSVKIRSLKPNQSSIPVDGKTCITNLRSQLNHSLCFACVVLGLIGLAALAILLVAFFFPTRSDAIIIVISSLAAFVSALCATGIVLLVRTFESNSRTIKTVTGDSIDTTDIS